MQADLHVHGDSPELLGTIRTIQQRVQHVQDLLLLVQQQMRHCVAAVPLASAAPVSSEELRLQHLMKGLAPLSFDERRLQDMLKTCATHASASAAAPTTSPGPTEVIPAPLAATPGMSLEEHRLAAYFRRQREPLQPSASPKASSPENKCNLVPGMAPPSTATLSTSVELTASPGLSLEEHRLAAYFRRQREQRPPETIVHPTTSTLENHSNVEPPTSADLTPLATATPCRVEAPPLQDCRENPTNECSNTLRKDVDPGQHDILDRLHALEETASRQDGMAALARSIDALNAHFDKLNLWAMGPTRHAPSHADAGVQAVHVLAEAVSALAT